MEDFFRWLLGPLWMAFFGRPEAARQATLLSTIAVGVEKQFPLVPFLEALADESRGRWGWKVRSLADIISNGMSIPDALEATPGVLSIEAIGMIRIGAESGNIAGALREAAILARRRSENSIMRIQGLLLYMCLLCGVLALITTFIMIWIIPKFKTIFDGFEARLPPLTEAVIAASDFGAEYWYLMMLFPLTLLFLWMTIPFSREVPGWRLMGNAPMRFAGGFWPRFRTPHILRCLSIAVDGGRPLSGALETLATRHPDRLLWLSVAELATRVARGDDCWQSLRTARMLRPGEAALLDAAQRTGNLAWALRGMADGIDRRADFRYQFAIEFMQPVLIVVLGAIIGTFCIGMFLPVVTIVRQLS